MATPHVAGIAATLAQKTGLRGRDLWRELERTALPLPQSAQEVGKGLAVVPTRRMSIVLPTPIRGGRDPSSTPVPSSPRRRERRSHEEVWWR